MNQHYVLEHLTVAPGERGQTYVHIPDSQDSLPITVINGAESGPRVLITAGVHGGEYAGVETAIRLGQGVNPNEVNGVIVIVHLVNSSGFFARKQYVNPVDGKNINRVFPGRADGTASEKIAAFLAGRLLGGMDFYMDLHGGDIHEVLTPCVVYSTLGTPDVREASRVYARQMGIEYVMPADADGATISCAAKAGIPGFLAEMGGSGGWNDEQVRMYLSGVKNVLRRLGALSREGKDLSAAVQEREGMFSVCARERGCWYPQVQTGDLVTKGQLIGRTGNFFGQILNEYKAERNGIVCYMVGSLAIEQGEPLYALM